MDASKKIDTENPKQFATREIAKVKILTEQSHALQAKKIIDASQVLGSFEGLIKDYPDMQVVHSALKADSFYEPVLKAALTPFILDRLSIFSEQYPTAYSQHIFCSWLAALIARNMKMDGKMATKVVRAALARDFGLLYLPQKLMDNKVKFSSEDWKAMRTHTIIGQMLVADVGDLGDVEARAVMEHHERQDGMGYPKGLKGKDISVAGQIIAAVDTVGAIRFKKFEHHGRNLRDVFAYIQMNEEVFSPKVVSALFHILARTGVEKSVVNPFNTVGQLVSHLYVRASAMSGSLRMMEKLLDVLLKFNAGPRRNEVLNVTGSVLRLIHQTGMLDEKMVKWLSALDSKSEVNDVGLEELSELELLQNELYWHIKRVSDLLQSFHDFEMKVDNPLAQTITTILRCLNQKNLPKEARAA